MSQTTITTTIADQMAAIVEQDKLAAELRRQVEASPLGLQARASEEKAAKMRAELRKSLEGTFGVNETPYGTVGFQLRETVTYKAADVRELAPDLAPLCISEAVDKGALERIAKAAIKAGKAPGDLLARLRERADVKEGKAWICQPKKEEA